jgi:hypothetical protein
VLALQLGGDGAGGVEQLDAPRGHREGVVDRIAALEVAPKPRKTAPMAIRNAHHPADHNSGKTSYRHG